MNGLTINLTITSLDQLRALEQALDLYVGSEGERVKSGVGEFSSKAEHAEAGRLVGAAEKLLKAITSGSK